MPNLPTQYGYTSNLNAYGGPYSNYPYRTNLPSLNMGGFNPYGAYGQPTNGQYRDPWVNIET